MKWFITPICGGGIHFEVDHGGKHIEIDMDDGEPIPF